MNAPHTTLLRIGMRFADGHTLVGNVLDDSHETVRARMDSAALSGLPRATLLVCIPGGKA